MTPELRNATPGDAEALASLWSDWGREYAQLDATLFREPSEEGLVDWFGEQIVGATDDDLWLVAVDDGSVVAFERAIVWRPGADARHSLVVDDALTTLKVVLLVVTPSARRNGLGAALTSRAERWGRDRGAERTIVVAMSDSPTAIPFYMSQGFRPFTTGMWKLLSHRNTSGR
jgi:GNAT superfamily N-acetyltransferase